MSDSPLQTRLLQSVGTSTSLLLGGSSAALSIFLVPRLLESPTPLLLRQWNLTHEREKLGAPPLTLLSALSYLYLAYREPSGSRKVSAYAAAAALATAIVPYSLLLMRSTNGRLKTKLEETRALGNTESVVEAGLGAESAHQLLDRWGVLNLGRAALFATAGVLGVWTALG